MIKSSGLNCTGDQKIYFSNRFWYLWGTFRNNNYTQIRRETSISIPLQSDQKVRETGKFQVKKSIQWMTSYADVMQYSEIMRTRGDHSNETSYTLDNRSSNLCIKD